MGRIFGTDGARGIAGDTLTVEQALDIGRAAAMVLAGEKAGGRRPLVLIGKDPRLSSDMLEAAVAAGLCSVGADVLRVGVLPTPAVAYLVRHYSADAGVMISASHNLAPYNGIKLFDRDGYKLGEELEEEIEGVILDGSRPYDTRVGAGVGRVMEDYDHARDTYVDYIAGLAQGDFSGFRILVDCANGAASHTAGLLFARIGAVHDIIFNEPNGLNINKECGSTHIDKLGERVCEGGYDFGIAFDGDADRLLAVDATGEPVSGDRIMAIIGSYLKGEGRLKKDTIAVTTMTNMGFFRFAQRAGIETAVTKVGDRYVLEHMLAQGLSFGGEQSGHFICLDHQTTGDGQMSAVLLLDALTVMGRPLDELKDMMEVYPQILLGVEATPDMKAELAGSAEVQTVIEAARAELAARGRVDVRPSGTEPLIRVMVEGEDEAIIKAVGDRIARAIEEHLK